MEKSTKKGRRKEEDSKEEKEAGLNWKKRPREGRTREGRKDEEGVKTRTGQRNMKKKYQERKWRGRNKKLKK